MSSPDDKNDPNADGKNKELVKPIKKKRLTHPKVHQLADSFEGLQAQIITIWFGLPAGREIFMDWLENRKDGLAAAKVLNHELDQLRECSSIITALNEAAVELHDAAKELTARNWSSMVTTRIETVEAELEKINEGSKSQFLGFKLLNDVTAEDVLWLVVALKEQGWICEMPTDAQMSQLFMKEGGSQFKPSTFSSMSAQRFLEGAEPTGGEDKEKYLAFRDFLSNFPVPNLRKNARSKKNLT